MLLRSSTIQTHPDCVSQGKSKTIYAELDVISPQNKVQDVTIGRRHLSNNLLCCCSGHSAVPRVFQPVTYARLSLALLYSSLHWAGAAAELECWVYVGFDDDDVLTYWTIDSKHLEEFKGVNSSTIVWVASTKIRSCHFEDMTVFLGQKSCPCLACLIYGYQGNNIN